MSRALKRERVDATVKCIVIGDSGVGKTSLLSKFADDSFDSTYISTIGIDVKWRVLKIGDRSVKVQVWDTAGQERFRAISDSYYREADGVVFCYSVASESSLTNVATWAKHCDDALNGRVISRVLVGCQMDRDDRVVQAHQGEAKAATLGQDGVPIPFFETSSKTGENVQGLFTTLSEDIMLRLFPPPPPREPTPPPVETVAVAVDEAPVPVVEETKATTPSEDIKTVELTAEAPETKKGGCC